MAARKSSPPWKTKAAAGSQSGGGAAAGSKKAKTKRKRKRKEAPLPPLMPPGTAVEMLRNGAWVGGMVTIRNDHTYMVRLDGGMTVLATRRRVKPAPISRPPPPVTDVSSKPDKAAGD